jgi:hypothetical protein
LPSFFNYFWTWLFPRHLTNSCQNSHPFLHYRTFTLQTTLSYKSIFPTMCNWFSLPRSM